MSRYKWKTLTYGVEVYCDATNKIVGEILEARSRITAAVAGETIGQYADAASAKLAVERAITDASPLQSKDER